MLATLLPALAALSWAGEGAALGERRMLVALGLCVFFAASFFAIESRAKRPIIALHLFRVRAFSASMLAMFGVALAMYAAISYAPLLFQTLLKMSPTRAGIVTAPLVVSLALTAVLAGRGIERGAGYAVPCAAGSLIAAAGMAWLSQLDADSSMLAAAGSMALVGAGLDFTMPSLLLAAQASVSQSHLGVTTALAKFSRSLGGLVGVAAAGAAIRYLEPLMDSPTAAMSRTMLLAAGAMLTTALLAILLPGRRAASAVP